MSEWIVTLDLIIAEREDRLGLAIWQNGFGFYQFRLKIDRKLIESYAKAGGECTIEHKTQTLRLKPASLYR
ncbi:MAG: hypothetical protein NT075_00220 [Chloroflexi bacterium]|nr:hypothetical protein [Chloroflexota bacterium]